MTATERNPSTPGEAITVVVAERPRSAVDELRELRRSPDLVYFLIRRELAARYSQTILGVGWAVLQPVLTMVVFSIFFGRVARVSSEGIPYPVFSLAAVVPWTYFSNAVNQGGQSLVNNVSLLKKIYFPRLLIPLAPLGAGLVDLGIALVVLLAVMAGYGFAPPPEALLLPVLVALLLLAAFGAVLWLSALGVQYRDVRFASPFLLQLWLFVTPVIYPASAVPDDLRLLYALNPLVGVIDGFRSVLLETEAFPVGEVLVSFGMACLLVATGLRYFRRVEMAVADVA